MGNVDIPKWLTKLPLAPEFHPTDTEFADPIAYISKIEKKASAFGICKIIPPLPRPSKKYVFHNLNKTLSKSPDFVDGVDLSSPCSSSKTGSRESEGESRAVFTTRHQELGQGMKKTKGVVKENPQLGVHKQVWQSGEVYTLEQFESKSKGFARSVLGSVKEITPLVVESLFWKAASEKPILVEYANDVPGSGFGEPQGQFQYFHRRRRKRVSYKSYRQSKENSESVTVGLGSVNNSSNEGDKGTGTENELRMSTEMVPHSSITSTSYTEEMLRTSDAINDMEDDIPGVTSPMIYIGMLFSWFAWHVEDHELHSMNFLHTGSPKTWYSIPGDYAFTFEEVIRTEAYGGSIDRLAALSMLGEKTTLLSPEMVVSSGIPCCRLVQNPGEFVVTFPRAYHVGFSHGFNCGEAANFATPQWLKVAKEAAVRRAAMNYLPMLSHQQLLYLLTMSFVSRVPRSLLPGARSSRLRDRLKEERELSVKKAFIEDILKENSTLSVILSKETDCDVMIWNPDLLPCATKESQLPSTISTMAENVLHAHSEDNSNSTGNDLFNEMSLYMETLNDLYMDNDDLSSDFQVDSGTLVCAACGILGFPFMSVVQPCDGASTEIFSAEDPGNCHSSAIPDESIRCSIPDLEVPTGWNNSNKCMRPRIFCLEHGLQIKELLRSKGGANRRIICHSDYQKMKAHAVSIAKEIDVPFRYEEVPLETASQQVLNLIYLALDGENRAESGEDWTSKLGINLRYCVKVRKNSPSSKVHHALALGGLFSDGITSDFSNVKWQSRKSRSRIKSNQPAQNNQSDAVEATEDDVSGEKCGTVLEKEERLIQYTRRKHKVNVNVMEFSGPCVSEADGMPEMQGGCQIIENIRLLNETLIMVSKGEHKVLAGKDDAVVDAVDDPALQVSTSPKEQTDEEVAEISCTDNGVSTCVVVADEMKQELQNGNASYKLYGSERSSRYLHETSTAEDKLQHEAEIISGSNQEELAADNVRLVNHPHHISADGCSGISRELCAVGDSCYDDTSNDRVLEALEATAEREEENVTCSATVEGGSEICATNDVSVSLEDNDLVEQKEIRSDDGSMENEADKICQATSESNGTECPFKRCSGNEDESLAVENSVESGVVDPRSTAKKGSKRKNELEKLMDENSYSKAFIRSPCEGLRPRAAKDATCRTAVDVEKPIQENPVVKKARKLPDVSTKKKETKRPHKCDLEGCRMSFVLNAELQLHKRNRCPYDGCKKRFSSHKYAIIHQRVHEDDRPLKCPWKGCSMSFKWAWARTEHIRVHTGEKPYQCKVEGCGLSFRFVSDYSRHRRKTGHYVNTASVTA
ncbi:Lysine-specific demethylase JMJ705 [Euphorbia peplus]|nr:Lysine-specific demethylase JMJ705 [Euphorbia peplus]